MGLLYLLLEEKRRLIFPERFSLSEFYNKNTPLGQFYEHELTSFKEFVLK
jgi:hypothetical protein